MLTDGMNTGQFCYGRCAKLITGFKKYWKIKNPLPLTSAALVKRRDDFLVRLLHDIQYGDQNDQTIGYIFDLILQNQVAFMIQTC